MGGIETDKGLQLCGWQAWWNLWTSWSMRKPISKQRSTSVLHSLKAHCSKPSLTNTHTQTHRETQTHTYKPTNTHTTHKHLHTHQLTSPHPHISGCLSLFNIQVLISVWLLFVTDCNSTVQTDFELMILQSQFSRQELKACVTYICVHIIFCQDYNLNKIIILYNKNKMLENE